MSIGIALGTPPISGLIVITETGTLLGPGPGDGVWFELDTITITPPPGEMWTGEGFTFRRVHTNSTGTTGTNSALSFNGEARVGEGTRNEALTERETSGVGQWAADEYTPLVVDIRFQDNDAAPDDIGITDMTVLISFKKFQAKRIEETLP